MKKRFPNQRNQALTLIEVLVVITVLVILFIIAIGPNWDMGGERRVATRINCVNNLKQIWLGCKIWSTDHGDKYPLQISVTNGGTMELALTGNVIVNFLVMSNELSTPKILFCPTDRRKKAAINFTNGLSATNISYFIGMDASEDRPNAFLVGDDNLTVDGFVLKSGLSELSAATSVAWGPGRHVIRSSHYWTTMEKKFVGNVGLTDGSVLQATTMELRNRIRNTGLATNRMAIP